MKFLLILFLIHCSTIPKTVETSFIENEGNEIKEETKDLPEPKKRNINNFIKSSVSALKTKDIQIESKDKQIQDLKIKEIPLERKAAQMDLIIKISIFAIILLSLIGIIKVLVILKPVIFKFLGIPIT